MKKNKIIRAVTVDQSLGFIEPLIENLKDKYEVQVLSSGGDNIDRICEQYDIKGHRIYMFRRISLFKDLKSLSQIIRVFRKEKPYMVHSMTPKAGLLCMIAAWITKVPRRVHTFTGLVWPTATGISKRVLILTDKITCACATNIIPEGIGVMEDLQKCITQKTMKVLGFGNIKGVDLIRFSYRTEIQNKAEYIRNKELFTFLFVGRITRDKGINELIAAFNDLNKKYSNIRLILVGNFEIELDPIETKTKDLIDENSLIEVVGPMYNDDLIAYYAASDCFVFPSYREGFPNTVMEAGAMSLPCIVTNINGSKEIIEDGKNGIVIPSKKVQALYDAMEKMITDNMFRTMLANNARPMIESRFEQGFVQQCLYDFYDEIM